MLGTLSPLPPLGQVFLFHHFWSCTELKREFLSAETVSGEYVERVAFEEQDVQFMHPHDPPKTHPEKGGVVGSLLCTS